VTIVCEVTLRGNVSNVSYVMTTICVQDVTAWKSPLLAILQLIQCSASWLEMNLVLVIFMYLLNISM